MIRNIYLLKDLARLTGYSTYTIKYYLKIGLIKEFGRSPQTNFRYFSDNTVKQLQHIRQLRKENKSIAEIKQVIRRRKKA